MHGLGGTGHKALVVKERELSGLSTWGVVAIVGLQHEEYLENIPSSIKWE
jgi:hypothetical protein